MKAEGEHRLGEDEKLQLMPLAARALFGWKLRVELRMPLPL